MTAVETVPKKEKLNARQVDLIGKIWEELARIYGREKAMDTEFLKQHIERSKDQVKTILHLTDRLHELQNMKTAKADDRE